MPFPDCSNYSDLGNYRGEGLECCLICDLAARGSSITSVGSVSPVGRRSNYARECPEGDSISRLAEPHLAAFTVNVSGEIFVLRDWQLHARFRTVSSEARLRADRRKEREREGTGENYQPRGQSSSFTSDSLRPRPDYLVLRKPDETN